MAKTTLEAFLVPIPLLKHNLRVIVDDRALRSTGTMWQELELFLHPSQLPRPRPPRPAIRLGSTAPGTVSRTAEEQPKADDQMIVNGEQVHASCIPIEHWQPQQGLRSISINPRPTWVEHGWHLTTYLELQLRGRAELIHILEAIKKDGSTRFFVAIDARLFGSDGKWTDTAIQSRVLSLLKRSLEIPDPENRITRQQPPRAVNVDAARRQRLADEKRSRARRKSTPLRPNPPSPPPKPGTGGAAASVDVDADRDDDVGRLNRGR